MQARGGGEGRRRGSPAAVASEPLQLCGQMALVGFWKAVLQGQSFRKDVLEGRSFAP